MPCSSCVPIPLCPIPIVSQSCCALVQLCPNPIVSRSNYAPIPLCSIPVVSKSHCVPVLLCPDPINPNPIVCQSHCVPVPLCPNPISIGKTSVRFMVLKTWVDSAWRACGGMEFCSLMVEGKKECLWVSALEEYTKSFYSNSCPSY